MTASIKKLTIGSFLFLSGLAVHAQDVTPQPATTEDTLTNAIGVLQSDMAALKKIKVSGYVQGQFQFCDSTGINTYAGGNFGTGMDKRFMIRRGRVKFSYVMPLSTAVVQLDATEKGVSTVEAYVVGTDPWMRAFSLTAGIFNRPFGYEIPYSSSLRESPERGRMSQIIMPGERDLGAMFTFQMPKESSWNWFKINAGMFNGTGKGASEFDTRKDFIGQLVIAKANKKETLKMSGGLSYYNGGVRQFYKKVWDMSSDTTGPIFHVDSTSTNIGMYARRQYMGADFQVSLYWIGGVTTLRGEFIQGFQPGTSSSTTSFTAAPTGDMFNREFNGAYFYFTQNIMQSKHQIVVKYDWYDPNTAVAGTEIRGGSSKTSSADIKYTTIGLGYIFHWDHNIKIMAYYDMVTNENTKIAGYTKDVRDNVLTLRMQYKF